MTPPLYPTPTGHLDDRRITVDSGEALDVHLIEPTRWRLERGVGIEFWTEPSRGRRASGTGATLASMTPAAAHELGQRLIYFARIAGWEPASEEASP